MTPGVELDMLIAERVMGYKWTNMGSNKSIALVGPSGTHNPDTWVWLAPDGKWFLDEIWGYPVAPKYSTSIEAAWQVVERLKDKRLVLRSGILSISRTLVWHVAFLDTGIIEENQLIENECMAESASHAICLAALAACGVDISSKT